MTEVLVVAGEPSGDRAASRVVAEARGARFFGLVGPASEAAGAEACARTTRSAALGVLDVAARAASVLGAMRGVRREVARRRPRVALLVNYTEFNARLLGFLRARGVRVVWYAAPQIWAWRAGRARAIARGVDAMAVVLPFEEALWRARGVDARYVGHPSMEVERLDRASARARLGLWSARSLAILPGSRASEVRRLLPEMLEAARGREARVLLTSALAEDVRAWTRAAAARAGVSVFDVDATDGAPRVLAAFDAALCASGTASLECAMADVPPVVTYRLDPVAALVARRALRTAHVALPNVLLGRRAFPELLQDDARAGRMRAALDALGASARDDCGEVRRVLGHGHAPARAVAEMIRRWS